MDSRARVTTHPSTRTRHTSRVPALVLAAASNPWNRRVVRETLEHDGFEVATAEDGGQALSIFQLSYPDLVLLDADLPPLDGFDVCRRIRSASEGERVPILVLTPTDDIEVIRRAYDAGATDFHPKQLSWTILAQKVRYLLRAAEALEAEKQSARNLKKECDFTRAVLDAARALVLVRGRDGSILRINRTCETTTGYTREEVENRKLWDFLSFQEEAAMERRIFQNLRSRKIDSESESHWITKVGIRRLIAWAHSPWLDQAGEVELVVSTGHDITERKEAEEQVQYLAYYDGLTHLPNRLLFKEHLNEALAYSQRHERLMAVLFLDIDRFKQINDTHGHSLGDQVLQAVSDRLRRGVRISDCVARQGINEIETSIGRYGGDEFTLLVTDVSGIEAAARIAQRILEAMSAPLELEGRKIPVTVSIGISIHPFDGSTSEILLKNADTAMYAAKNHGRNGYHFYTPSMNRAAPMRLSIEGELELALGHHEFEFYYQPKLAARTGGLTGAEALIRWNHPNRGLLPPSDFIPQAEKSGLIVRIGEWGLSNISRQSISWQASGIIPIPIAVNISAAQFYGNTLLEILGRILVETGIDPRFLELEIAESTIIQNQPEAERFLRRLKSTGILLSLDNCGTGPLSLALLKRLTLDSLKIDRSSVTRVKLDREIREATAAYIAMGHSLGLTVLAEGVESRQDLESLREQDCDQVQGFFLGPPLRAEEFRTVYLDNGYGLQFEPGPRKKREPLFAPALMKSSRKSDPAAPIAP